MTTTTGRDSKREERRHAMGLHLDAIRERHARGDCNRVRDLQDQEAWLQWATPSDMARAPRDLPDWERIRGDAKKWAR